VRVSLALPALILVLAGCPPPRATQFVGQDGSRDWWTVECGEDEVACWSQAKAACHDNFKVHEIRKGEAPPQSLALTVHEGVVPELPAKSAIRDQTLVITCDAPTVPPRFVAGPECATSPPRPNHCEDAAGLSFSTGRTYLPPAVDGARPVVSETKETPPPDAALAELRTLTDGLDEEIAAIAEPLASVQGVATAIRDFPRTYRMNPAQWKAIVKAQLGQGTATLPTNLRPEVMDDMGSLLAKVKAADSVLRATSAKAEALLDKIAARDAKLRTVGVPASADVQELEADVRKKLDAIRTKVMALSSQILVVRTQFGEEKGP
jgi:hypothetical protein